MWAGIEPATGVPLAMMKSNITHIMVSRKDATNYAKLAGLSQFDRLARVEPHSSYDLPTPAWKAGVLPNKLMRHIRAPPQTFRQEGALHVGCAALDKLLAIKHELCGFSTWREIQGLNL